MTGLVEFVAFPAIVVMCYLVGFICKTIGNKTLDKFIPCICGVLGAILGVVIYLTIPNFIPAENWAVAIAIGIVSGFAATGVNQIYKQLKLNK